ncbi:MAG: hypothetical protein KJ990_04330 [Proteobacteria bacterium]|nr:hypothetical protein [Pseudomonadota bacterium]MBU1649925.1 hypothetical protein [Pseudomonadota bacterium]
MVDATQNKVKKYFFQTLSAFGFKQTKGKTEKRYHVVTSPANINSLQTRPILLIN